MLALLTAFPSWPRTVQGRTSTLLMSTRHPPSLVVALDFDGVLCDSEPELTRTAWRTARALWPSLMEETAALEGTRATPGQLGARKAWAEGSWDELRGNGEDGLPRWLRAKLRLLRPIVETGFESVLLLRLCAEEALASGPAKRPLTIGEITANWGPELRETLLERYRIPREDLVAAFGATRDAWIAEDETETAGTPAGIPGGGSWLGANAFYDGAMDSLRAALVPGSDVKVYFVTTKQARFADQLLRSQQIELPEGTIFGLGSGPKPDTLALLRQKYPEATLRFVEDKAETVRAAADDLRLFSVGLYFAEWGYSTPEQAALAASMPRVQSLAQARDLASVLQLRGDTR